MMARPAWIKRNSNVTFDVSMGSYDWEEVCELVGLFILNSLSKKLGNDNVALCRDDGLVLLKGSSKCLADKARKELHKLFKEFQLRITADLCNPNSAISEQTHFLNFIRPTRLFNSSTTVRKRIESKQLPVEVEVYGM